MGRGRWSCGSVQVLRFYCYWDDKTRYGQRMYYVLYFFLADDSVEIAEVHQRNSGEAPFRLLPVLVKNGLSPMFLPALESKLLLEFRKVESLVHDSYIFVFFGCNPYLVFFRL